MESLYRNKFVNHFLSWKITFMLLCDNVLLADFYEGVLKFIENVPENSRTINNSYLGTAVTLCSGTCILSKSFSMQWSTISIEYLLHLKILFSCSTSVWKCSILEHMLKHLKRSLWSKATLQLSKLNLS